MMVNDFYLEKRQNFLPDFLIVAVEPLDLGWRHQPVVDQHGLEGDQSHGFELKKLAYCFEIFIKIKLK